MSIEHWPFASFTLKDAFGELDQLMTHHVCGGGKLAQIAGLASWHTDPKEYFEGFVATRRVFFEALEQQKLFIPDELRRRLECAPHDRLPVLIHRSAHYAVLLFRPDYPLTSAGGEA